MMYNGLTKATGVRAGGPWSLRSGACKAELSLTATVLRRAWFTEVEGYSVKQTCSWGESDRETEKKERNNKTKCSNTRDHL